MSRRQFLKSSALVAPALTSTSYLSMSPAHVQSRSMLLYESILKK
jgi:hypothetical protein